MSILNFFKDRDNTEKDRYVLSIDGGGIRGIIPVMVLQKLEEILRNKGHENALQSYFDLIAGTSTGGLIAASLAFPTGLANIGYNDTNQVNLKVLEKIYMNMGYKIFPKGNLIQSIVNVPYQVIGDKYPVDGFESLLKCWFGEQFLGESNVNLLLMAFNLTQGKGELLTNYGSPDFKVVDACRATSAAPTYFAPLVHNDSLLADGGLIANNPSLYAYREVKRLYPNCRKVHILSLGTAASVHKTDSGTTSGLINWVDQILPIYQTAQRNSIDYIMAGMPDVEYLRIDAELAESIRLDDIRERSMQTLNRFGKKLAEDNSSVLQAFTSTLTG